MQQEFPLVFDNGGFDVVIGNPPYVPAEYIDEHVKAYLEDNYESAFGRLNLYPIFYELGLKLLKADCRLSFITPYTITKNHYYIEARRYILNNSTISSLVDFKGKVVFEDAAVDSIILSLIKSKTVNARFTLIENIGDFAAGLYSERDVKQDDIIHKKDLSFNVSLNE